MPPIIHRDCEPTAMYMRTILPLHSAGIFLSLGLFSGKIRKYECLRARAHTYRNVWLVVCGCPAAARASRLDNGYAAHAAAIGRKTQRISTCPNVLCCACVVLFWHTARRWKSDLEYRINTAGHCFGFVRQERERSRHKNKGVRWKRCDSGNL